MSLKGKYERMKIASLPSRDVDLFLGAERLTISGRGRLGHLKLLPLKLIGSVNSCSATTGREGGY